MDMMGLLWIALVAGSPAVPDSVLATFDGGVVRETDVAREIRFQTKDERRYRDEMGMPMEKRRLDWIRRVALRTIAHAEAERTGFAAREDVAEVVRTAGRQWLLGQWRERCYGQPFTALGGPELDRQLAATPAAKWPLGLRLSHLFRKAETEAERQAAMAELTALRPTIDSLETFQRQAQERSDSQSAWNGGKLGMLRQGQLPDAAEEILYALEAGTVSPPIALRGGVHLFFVEQRREAGTMPEERRRKRLVAQHRAEARQVCRATAMAAAQEALSVRRADGRLTVGAWSIDEALLASRFAQEDEALDSVVARYTEDELLYQTGLAWDGWDTEERARVADVEGDALLRQVVSAAVEAGLKPVTDEALAEAFAKLDRPFRDRRKLQMHTLRTKLEGDTDPLAFLSQLETLADRLRGDEVTWQQAEQLAPGTAAVRTLPPTDTLDVAGMLGPSVFERIKALPAGQVSAPLQDGATFWLVEIEADIPARDLTFEESLPRLRKQTRKAQSRALAEAETARLLATAKVEITTAGVAAIEGAP